MVLLILLECLSWLFSFLLIKDTVIKYLIVQRIFFFMGLVGILWRDTLLIRAIILKMGLPPFHIWFYKISFLIDKRAFLFFTTIHKIIPLFFLLKVRAFYLLGISIRVLLISIILIVEVGGLFYVVILSSIVHSSWMLILCCFRVRTLFLYWLVYLFLISMLFRRLFLTRIVLSDEAQSSISSLIWLVICGLPPFAVFWLKVNIISMLFVKRFIFRVIIILASVVSLVVYYRIYHLSIFITKIVVRLKEIILLVLFLGIF